MEKFNNKVAWITGATSGIGEHLVYKLNQYNCVTIISSRREEELLRVKNNCDNPNLVYIQILDLEKPEEFDGIVEVLLKKFENINYLFNNGGISQRSFAEETELSVVRKIMEVNFFGNISLTRSLLPAMVKAGSGHIVVTSSAAGKFGFFKRSAYSASKHALHGYYESLRLENYNNNIKVTLVIPGPVNTNMASNALLSDGKKHGKSDRLLSEGMSPSKVAHKILRGVARQKEEITMGGKELIPIYIKRFLPSLFTGIMKNYKPEG